jgi:hypothetical protein
MTDSTTRAIVAMAVLFVSGLLTGCESLPKQAMVPAADALKTRQIQSRRYDGISEEKLLAATAGVIQDLGFNIDESETRLGLITGSKQRSAVEPGQVFITFLAVLGGSNTAAIDKTQKLRVSVVVRPVGGDSTSAFQVRVTFQRMVWRTDNTVSRAESLKQPVLYQEFFDKLSKAVFLEAQEVQ